MRTICAFAGAWLVAVAGASAARADDKDEWTVVVAPYIWLAGLEGDIGVGPGLPAVSVDATFGDILSHLDPSLMLFGEVRNDRFGFLADILYIRLSADGDTSGPAFSDAEVKTSNFIGTFEGAYRVFDADRIDLDLLAGIRVWSVDTELSLGAGLLPARVVESTEVWADPIVGVRARAELGSGFYLTGWGNVGGFGAASDLTWDLFGGAGYEWNSWLSTVAGYRHLEVDYDHEGFLYDVSQTGPIVGGVLRF